MRYLVTARVKPGQRDALGRAIEDGRSGPDRWRATNTSATWPQARQLDDGRVQWVEVCYCATPLAEEREYWEHFFDA